MRILYFLLCNFLFFQPIYSFQRYKIPTPYLYKNNQPQINIRSQSNDISLDHNKKINIIKKIKSISSLIRSVNILPTLFLTFSGGWIIKPSINTLLYSRQFILANIVTLLVMSLSMVLNDLYDIELDKTNNPMRPLITGEITKKEAILFSSILLGIIKILSIIFLPHKLDQIVNIVLFGIGIYTPVIKKIPFLKNIFCALVISFSIYYSGLAIEPNLIHKTMNYPILLTTIRYIFLGSLTIELLLDICDVEGDKNNNIMTLPVLIGKERTWYFICSLIEFNMYNISSIISINTIRNVLLQYNNTIIMLLFFPIIIDIYNIKKNNFKKETIINAVKSSTIPMFFMLLYMCILAT